MKLRDYTYLGTTQSLCPECLQLVPAKIVSRRQRVYFRKRCPQHGVREDFICSDVRWYDRMEFSLPGKVPPRMGVEPNRGCPFDCGLCTEHEQHTCIGLLEITSSCNLTCPLCFAASAPGGEHLSFEQCRAAIDRLVQVEGKPEVLQLSGGEPTVHPEMLRVLDYACDQPIDLIMINTNGIRFARDKKFVEQVAERRKRVEVYLQFDGFDDIVNENLRGESLLETKMTALDNLADAGLNVTLVSTLQAGVNESQVGEIVRFGLQRRHVTGISFQPATYSGRYYLPEQLEQRVTFPDVVRYVCDQSGDVFRESDFMPLPCAHPNGHSLAYAYRSADGTLPLTRFIDIAQNLDLLANGIVFNRTRARQLIDHYLARQSCGGADCGCETSLPAAQASLLDAAVIDGGNHPVGSESEQRLASEFFRRALTEDLNQADVFRITITSFMDAYNFDVRQLMKSCVHHVLPSGHLIPFSAYNVLYRDGHVPLPDLVDVPAGEVTKTSLSAGMS